MTGSDNQTVAVIGSGAAGLSAAWLLRLSRDVTLFEKDDRLGGHAHTAVVDTPGSEKPHAIDTGFIVYNDQNYPNFSRWLKQLGIATQSSDMTFSVSRNNGEFEYKGGTVADLLVQPSNLLKPGFYRMIRDLMRFYRTYGDGELPASDISLAQLLESGGYSRDFVDDHLLPFAAAIWSSSPGKILDYPAASFIRFCRNHGLLDLSGRPQWRTVIGGSQAYVRAIRQALGSEKIRTSVKVCSVKRTAKGVLLEDREGNSEFFDHVVFASHADHTRELLDDADSEERRLLQPFEYEQNLAILHTDTTLMPRRRRAWASWNYLIGQDVSVAAAGTGKSGKGSVSYWMNSLQNIEGTTDYIVSLNPVRSPRPDSILRTALYEHPIFNGLTFKAQKELWSLQGRRNTWFCGAYFGAGFHEDAIQSGLAVAEQLGDFQRPWEIENASDRIFTECNSTDQVEVTA